MKKIIYIAFLLFSNLNIHAQISFNFDKFIELRNQQAFRNYERLNEKNINQNLMFSPFFLDFSFSQIYIGAKSGTAAQIANAEQFVWDKLLHLDNFYRYQKIIDGYNSLNNNLKYSINLFYPDTLKAIKNYLINRKTITIFDSLLPYDSKNISEDQLRSLIDNTISKNTDNYINEYTKDLKLDSVNSLLSSSAAFFSGIFANNFNNYFYAPFYINAKGKSVKNVKYITTNDYFKYGAGAEYQIIQIPYAGYNLSLVIIMPFEKMELNSSPDFFRYEFYKLWREQTLQTERVRLVLPVLSLDERYNIEEVFDTITSSIFKKGGNFLNMFKALVYVSSFSHYAKFEIKGNEQQMTKLNYVNFDKEQYYDGSIIFFVDHPFFFFLIDEKTNAILFMGRVVNPNEK